MTGLELRNYIVYALGRTDKDTQIYAAVKDVLLKLMRRYALSAFQDEAYTTGITTLGDYAMAVPSDFGRIVSGVRLIDGTNSYPLVPVSKGEFDEWYPNPSATGVQKGRPFHYTVFGGYILVGPVPDSVAYQYELSYAEGTISDITAASTVPLSDQYRDVLKYGVLAEVYCDLGNDAEASKWTAKFEQAASELQAADQGNTRGVMTTQYRGI